MFRYKIEGFSIYCISLAANYKTIIVYYHTQEHTMKVKVQLDKETAIKFISPRFIDVAKKLTKKLTVWVENFNEIKFIMIFTTQNRNARKRPFLCQLILIDLSNNQIFSIFKKCTFELHHSLYPSSFEKTCDTLLVKPSTRDRLIPLCLVLLPRRK